MRATVFGVCAALTGCFSVPPFSGTETDTDAAVDGVMLPPHDEDGDTVDDSIDTCPHLAVPQTDGDGDGVGDACDPQPADTTTPDRMWFYSFDGGDLRDLVRVGTVTPHDNYVEVGTLDSAENGLLMPVALKDSDVEIGYEVVTAVDVLPDGIVVGISQPETDPSAGAACIVAMSSSQKTLLTARVIQTSQSSPVSNQTFPLSKGHLRGRWIGTALACSADQLQPGHTPLSVAFTTPQAARAGQPSVRAFNTKTWIRDPFAAGRP